MNNSLERLIDGMIDTLIIEVIPNTQGEFARGQAFGVIFMLKSIRRRAAWSATFLREQLDALRQCAVALARIDGLPAEAPRPERGQIGDDAQVLEAIRDAGDATVCALIDWLSAHRTQLDQAVAEQIDAAIDGYIGRQLKHEIATSAKPMFAEISLGYEPDKEDAS